jgi:hypothetical protein
MFGEQLRGMLASRFAASAVVPVLHQVLPVLHIAIQACSGCKRCSLLLRIVSGLLARYYYLYCISAA